MVSTAKESRGKHRSLHGAQGASQEKQLCPNLQPSHCTPSLSSLELVLRRRETLHPKSRSLGFKAKGLDGLRLFAHSSPYSILLF